jgi:hypothetical protein
MPDDISPPSYSPDKFVNREAEIQLVMEAATVLARGTDGSKPAIIFQGERGIGKSWLLKHLSDELKKSVNSTVFLLDLAEYRDQNSDLAVRDVLKKLATEALEQSRIDGVSLAELSRALKQAMRPILEKQPLILLIDTVYESDWKILEGLENFLLGPLVSEPRTMIVLAGRGRPYPWKTLELRIQAQPIRLEPFPNKALTQKQLELQHGQPVSRVDQIHEISGGNPLTNYLLAACDSQTDALDEVIEGILNIIPKKQDRQVVREYLEALCVLDVIYEECILDMLAAYYNDESYRQRPYEQAKQVRHKLMDWHFIRWDSDRGGYALDESTRRLMERYLETSDRKITRRLHEAAYRLYDGWADQYQAQTRWQPRIEYHRRRLDALRGNQ